MFAYSWAGSEIELEQLETVTWEDAACRGGSGSLTEIFFSDEMNDIELAKAICNSCSLVKPCLEGALERREPAGVWGAQLFADGQVIPRKRKRGRPPKVARPDAEPDAAKVVLRGIDGERAGLQHGAGQGVGTQTGARQVAQQPGDRRLKTA